MKSGTIITKPKNHIAAKTIQGPDTKNAYRDGHATLPLEAFTLKRQETEMVEAKRPIFHDPEIARLYDKYSAENPSFVAFFEEAEAELEGLYRQFGEATPEQGGEKPKASGC